MTQHITVRDRASDPGGVGLFEDPAHFRRDARTYCSLCHKRAPIKPATHRRALELATIEMESGQKARVLRAVEIAVAYDGWLLHRKGTTR